MNGRTFQYRFYANFIEKVDHKNNISNNFTLNSGTSKLVNPQTALTKPHTKLRAIKERASHSKEGTIILISSS